jgi:uncharacterized membrane protein
MKKFSMKTMRRATFVTLCASLVATLVGFLLASGSLRFTNDAYDDLLLTYAGIIISLVGITLVALSWLGYVLASQRQGKTTSSK